MWSRILQIFHRNDHHIETCHTQDLGRYLEGRDEHSDSWTKALEMVFNSSDLSTATYIRDFLKKKIKKKLVPTLPNFFQAVPLNTELFFFGLTFDLFLRWATQGPLGPLVLS